MDILQYIDKIKQNYGNEPVPVRYNTQKYLRPGFRGGQLVDHGPAGVRQGYGGPGSGGAWKGPKSEAAREAAYKKIFEAQKEFVKKNKRFPTREEMIKLTKSGPLAIRSAMKKYGFQLFNKPGEFKTPPEKKEASYKKRTETVRSQTVDEPKTIKIKGKRVDVRFPSPSIKEAFITDLSGRFEYPKGSVEGKGKFLTNADLLEKYYKGKKGFDAASKLNEHISLITKEQAFEYPLQTYEGHRKVEEINKKRRLKFIKQTSSPKIEAIIKNIKIGEKVDLAHRMSLKEVAKLGTDYLATSLGWDQTKVNQEIVRPFENKIGRLYDRRSKLIKNLVPGEVPKNIQVEIENINKQVSELVDRTKGRLHGILINEKNLKPIRYGVDHSTILGFGLIKDKPVSKLTQADLIMAELNLPQQIKQEKIKPPILKSEVIPGSSAALEKMPKYLRSIAQSYKTTGLVPTLFSKVLPPVGIALGTYFSQQAYKEGRPAIEVAAEFFGAGKVPYKIKEYLSMTKEEKAAEHRRAQQNMAESGLQDPRVRGGGKFKPDFRLEGDEALLEEGQRRFKEEKYDPFVEKKKKERAGILQFFTPQKFDPNV